MTNIGLNIHSDMLCEIGRNRHPVDVENGGTERPFAKRRDSSKGRRHEHSFSLRHDPPANSFRDLSVVRTRVTQGSAGTDLLRNSLLRAGGGIYPE